MITLTKKAVAKIKEISELEGIGHTCIRVKIVGGGCAGMMHDMSFEDVKRDDDDLIEMDGVKLIIDPISAQYMENTTVDWEDRIISSGFTFKSPDITGSCGCGKSVSY